MCKLRKKRSKTCARTETCRVVAWRRRGGGGGCGKVDGGETERSRAMAEVGGRQKYGLKKTRNIYPTEIRHDVKIQIALIIIYFTLPSTTASVHTVSPTFPDVPRGKFLDLRRARRNPTEIENRGARLIKKNLCHPPAERSNSDVNFVDRCQLTSRRYQQDEIFSSISAFRTRLFKIVSDKFVWIRFEIVDGLIRWNCCFRTAANRCVFDSFEEINPEYRGWIKHRNYYILFFECTCSRRVKSRKLHPRKGTSQNKHSYKCSCKLHANIPPFCWKSANESKANLSATRNNRENDDIFHNQKSQKLPNYVWYLWLSLIILVE